MDEKDRLIQLLRRPAFLRLRLDRFLQDRETCRLRCSRVTPRYGGISSSKGTLSRNDDSLASLAEMDRKLSRCRDRLRRASRDVETLLRAVEDLPSRTAPRDALFLRLRYLRGLSGEALHAALEQAGFHSSRQTVYSWQRSAIRSGLRALSTLTVAVDGDQGDCLWQ